MLLQKTGWRIRDFISHRRRNSFEGRGDGFEEQFHNKYISTAISKRGSWLSQIPTVVSAKRTSVSTSRSARSPWLPIATAHSSESSMCSCDCLSNAIQGAVPLPVVQSATPTEILYHPPVPSTTASGDAKTWQLIFPGKQSRSLSARPSNFQPHTLSLTSTRPEPTFTLLEALAIDPVDDDLTPAQSNRNMQNYDMAEFADNVDQLIKETDKAFHAVGLALTDAKAVTYEWHDNTVITPIIRNGGAVRNGASKKRSIPNISAKNTSFSRSNSVVKAKKQPLHLRKTKQPSRTGPRHVSLSSIPPERWTLTNVTSNLVVVFSGKIFKTEVDEILTAGRMQLLKDNGIETSRKRSLKPRTSIDSDDNASTEPFHLEGLSASVDASAQISQSPFPDPILPPSPIPKRSEARRIRAITEKNVHDGIEMVFEDLAFPSPPRNSSRAGPLGQQLLSTIPQISSVTLVPPQTYRKDKRKGNFDHEPMQDIITLFSTPFTLTSPLFRHGPIRINRKKTILPEEEALDWTAFQMAILGTMNSDTSESLVRESDADEMNSLTEWFAEFGFESPGALIRETPNRTRIKDFVKDVTDKRGPLRGTLSEEKMLMGGDLKESLVWGVRLEDGGRFIAL